LILNINYIRFISLKAFAIEESIRSNALNAWSYLLLGICVEVIGTMSLKLSNGFTKLVYSGLSLCCFAIALFCIARAARVIDLSVAYALWSGVGIILISLGSVALFDEKMTLLKIFFMALIIVGVVGLRVMTEKAA
jgi:small multidrug resistance pump